MVNKQYMEQKNVKKDGISGQVEFLHYVFEGWLGDDLIESTPTFIISHNLKNELLKSEFRDYKLEDCSITTSDEFKELLEFLEKFSIENCDITKLKQSNLF